MSVTSVSASAIRRAYIDEATKAALLGTSPATSFGLPMSTAVSFPVSALALGPVTLVPAIEGGLILPLYVICGAQEPLSADIPANLGWPSPDPEDTGLHDEPWLAAPSSLWFADDEAGSLVILPHVSALPTQRLWPECVKSRPLVVEASAPPARSTKKRRTKGSEHAKAEAQNGEHVEGHAEEEVEHDPILTVVTFYTVF